MCFKDIYHIENVYLISVWRALLIDPFERLCMFYTYGFDTEFDKCTESLQVISSPQIYNPNLLGKRIVKRVVEH